MELRSLLSSEPSALRDAWPGLSTLERLACFQLLEAGAARAFFAALGFDDQYLLLCGFDRGAIAPLLEDAPAGAAAAFPRRDAACYQEMLRLCS